MLKFKIIGLALALVLVAGLVAVASGATGAYFGDTKTAQSQRGDRRSHRQCHGRHRGRG